ncbi:hypothetical protein [Actibacterium sp. XHP0104]|uniref:hypothetical protein n=1 Tax=Actibacterium sp. XHP0104 TaxID=2984335 RepID=UPI0021E6DD93|nr:hypothetical protein [Actibacterium sp. XHP0104]MCV2882992.1 hypothetical protein [Actibacterium sp. XHP0104]
MQNEPKGRNTQAGLEMPAGRRAKGGNPVANLQPAGLQSTPQPRGPAGAVLQVVELDTVFCITHNLRACTAAQGTPKDSRDPKVAHLHRTFHFIS